MALFTRWTDVVFGTIRYHGSIGDEGTRQRALLQRFEQSFVLFGARVEILLDVSRLDVVERRDLVLQPRRHQSARRKGTFSDQ